MDTAQVESPLGRVIRILGGQRAAGAACGKSQQFIWYRLNHVGGTVPADIAVALELAVREKGTDEQVTRHELCPSVAWDAQPKNAQRMPA